MGTGENIAQAAEKIRTELSACLIGAGRLGQTVAQMCRAAGMRFHFVLSGSEQSAQAAAALLEAPRWFAASHAAGIESELQNLPTDSVVLLAVPDDPAPRIAQKLAEARPDWNGSTVLHFSGAHSLALLQPFKERGARIGALHPCMPIYQPAAELPAECCYTFRGEADVAELCRQFVARWRGQFFVIPEDTDLSLYHAGAVLAAGHLVTLLAASREAIAASGLSSTQAAEISKSLAAAVLEATKDSASLDALAGRVTGPFVRGDSEVISRHVAALERLAPELGAAYRTLGALCRRLLSFKR